MRRDASSAPCQPGPKLLPLFPVLMTALHAAGKGTYFLSKAKSQSHCLFLSAFPTHGCVLKKKNTLFHSAFVTDIISPSVWAGGS